MEPRYKRTPSAPAVTDMFLGYAGEVDVWISLYEFIIVIGPPSRILANTFKFNYDTYSLDDGMVVPDDGSGDVHIELSEMCEIYQLLETFQNKQSNE